MTNNVVKAELSFNDKRIRTYEVDEIVWFSVCDALACAGYQTVGTMKSIHSMHKISLRSLIKQYENIDRTETRFTAMYIKAQPLMEFLAKSVKPLANRVFDT